MPNIKSAKKRVLVTKLQNDRNRARKSALKSQLKKIDAAITAGSENAMDIFRASVKAIDKAVSKGILHKNAAARKKSKLAAKLNASK